MRGLRVLGRLVLVALLAAGLLVLAYPGYREAHFADARVAREPPQRSPLPPFVPDTAKDVHLLTNLDTMATWGCFRLPAGKGEFQSWLAAEGAVRRAGEWLPRAERMLGSVPWWPSAMSEAGIERYDLPPHVPGEVTMIGLSPRDDRVCFYGGRTG